MIEVKVNGKKYGGWKSSEISKSVENLCGTFSMTVHNSWAEANESPEIKAGDYVNIVITNTKKEEIQMMAGYVDIETTGFNNSGTFLSISGRDITCDLIDCSVEDLFEMRNLGPIEIIRKLATEDDIEKFYITVTTSLSDSDFTPYPQNLINYDAKIADVIKKISSHYGFLVYTNEYGELVVENASKLGDTIPFFTEGKNLISASRQYDFSKNYKTIKVVSQDIDLGGTIPTKNPEENENLNRDGVFTDESFSRYRPLNVVHSEGTDGLTPKIKAEWIKRSIQAKSSEIRLEVQGWEDEEGGLYKINTQVACNIPSLGISTSDAYMIKELTMSVSEDGKKTKLVVIHEDAYNENSNIKDDDGQTEYGSDSARYANQKSEKERGGK
jgi:prophage tail gpP-like protein